MSPDQVHDPLDDKFEGDYDPCNAAFEAQPAIGKLGSQDDTSAEGEQLFDLMDSKEAGVLSDAVHADALKCLHTFSILISSGHLQEITLFVQGNKNTALKNYFPGETEAEKKDARDKFIELIKSKFPHSSSGGISRGDFVSNYETYILANIDD